MFFNKNHLLSSAKPGRKAIREFSEPDPSDPSDPSGRFLQDVAEVEHDIGIFPQLLQLHPALIGSHRGLQHLAERQGARATTFWW